jgi:hypothetical protein
MTFDRVLRATKASRVLRVSGYWPGYMTALGCSSSTKAYPVLTCSTGTETTSLGGSRLSSRASISRLSLHKLPS